jgi:hypothetical protein
LGTAGFSPAWQEGIMPLSYARGCVQLNLPHIMWIGAAFYRRGDEVNEAMRTLKNFHI